jgi:hypothetical protein
MKAPVPSHPVSALVHVLGVGLPRLRGAWSRDQHPCRQAAQSDEPSPSSHPNREARATQARQTRRDRRVFALGFQ